jgi:hypothetical protein
VLAFPRTIESLNEKGKRNMFVSVHAGFACSYAVNGMGQVFSWGCGRYVRRAWRSVALALNLRADVAGMAFSATLTSKTSSRRGA